MSWNGRMGDSRRRTPTRTRPFPPRWWWLWTALIVVGAAIAIPYAVSAQNRWEAWCRGQGGVVSSHTTWTVVPDNRWSDRRNTNGGGTTTTSDTTYYCITGDGRLLGVR